MFEFRFQTEFLEPDWSSFQILLTRLFLSYTPQSTDPTPASILGEALWAAEQPWHSAIDRTIERLCEAGSSSTDSPQVAYFLSLRAEAIAVHLLSMTISHDERGTSTIIPFPEQAPQRVARWFLIPWWRVHWRSIAGRVLRAKQI